MGAPTGGCLCRNYPVEVFSLPKGVGHHICKGTLSCLNYGGEEADTNWVIRAERIALQSARITRHEPGLPQCSLCPGF